MLTALGLIIAVLIVALGVVLPMLSRSGRLFQETQSVVIEAPPDRVRPMIDDLHIMERWNPYLMGVPAEGRSHVGPEAGPGAGFAFTGPGERMGRADVIASALFEVVVRFRITKPVEVENTGEFSLQLEPGAGTLVTWVMHGDRPLLARAVPTLTDDGVLAGRDMAEGLANLKRLAEADQSLPA